MSLASGTDLCFGARRPPERVKLLKRVCIKFTSGSYSPTRMIFSFLTAGECAYYTHTIPFLARSKRLIRAGFYSDRERDLGGQSYSRATVMIVLCRLLGQQQRQQLLQQLPNCCIRDGAIKMILAARDLERRLC